MEALPHKNRENRTRWILQLFLGHLEVCCEDSKLARVARVGSTCVSLHFCFECVVLHVAAGAVSCGRHVMPGHGQKHNVINANTFQYNDALIAGAHSVQWPRVCLCWRCCVSFNPGIDV